MYQHRGQLGEVLASLVPARQRCFPFWNAGDALIMFGLMMVLAGVAQSYLLSQGVLVRQPIETDPPLSDAQTAANQYVLIAISLVVGLMALGVMLAFFRSRSDKLLDRLGLRVRRGDVVLGLKASLMVLPPVLVISGLLNLVIPYEHPVLEILAGIDSVPKLVLVFVTTAIATPLVEEFLFRTLLIGGFERLAQAMQVGDLQQWERDQGDQPWKDRFDWPVIASSFIFAIMHFGHGAAPVPLFVLALALGYLYRRTGSIVAPIVVHMVLNSLTLIVETLRVNT
ncbi:CPBP family intramembrane glutamic endopeptidase [Rubripirellula amarantea]|uniref:CPBP family intramembrane glutamic endopeptidase n=1 Tax=Rubripirellula amarantea TaxID=2527999 RepID=UPI0013EF0997|nr:CPBP family intramembrane glutamic endopeptidase [Rubripirellula amarantea]